MLRMTKQADYGFVLLSRLAAEPERIVNAPDLAAETRLPVPTVSKILKLLAKGGVLRSARGVHGGYSLTKPADAISAAELLTALEGPVALTLCIDAAPGECDHETYCQVRSHRRRINQALEEALGRITLAELAGSPQAVEPVERIGANRAAVAMAGAGKPAPLAS
jgi:FeS assembly SUF system regulator